MSNPPESEGRFSNLRSIALMLWEVTPPFARVRLSVALVLVISTSIVTAIAPLLLKWVVDAISSNAQNLSTPILLIVLYVLSQWASRVLMEIRGFIQSQADRRIYRALNDRVFSHIMQLPLRFHLERRTGGISEMLSSGVGGYQSVIQTVVSTFLPLAVELFTVTFILIKIDQTVLIGLFCIALLCYGVAFSHGTVRTTNAARNASTAQIDAGSIMTDSILNYETVKYFTAEPIVRAAVDKALSRTECEWVRFYSGRAIAGVVVATIFAAFLGGAVVYSAHETLLGRMTVGTFVLVNTYMFQLVRPIESLGFAIQQLAQGFVFLEKMHELFRQKPEDGIFASNVSGNRSPDTRTTPGTLVFEGINVSYRSNQPVLRNVSFEVPSGKTLGIVGASGAGKSTLVRLLMRFIEPDGGRILLNGAPIADLSLRRLRESIAVVPQDTVLFNNTLAYNIAFGRPGCSEAEIEQAAKLAQLHDFIMSLPDRYQTNVGERGVKLSGGEKQRIAIARAVIKQPGIFVFDEATSSLDTRTEREILRNLGEISRDRTTLVIAHRLSTVASADEIIVLQEGTIVERGSHEELLLRGGAYARLWNAQAAIRRKKRHQQPSIASL